MRLSLASGSLAARLLWFPTYRPEEVRLSEYPANDVRHRTAVMQLTGAALDAVDPYHAVLRTLEGRPIPPTGNIYVVGAGKAGAAMARATEAALGDRITGGLVIV